MTSASPFSTGGRTGQRSTRAAVWPLKARAALFQVWRAFLRVCAPSTGVCALSVGSCAPAPLWDIVPLLAALYRDRTISTELKEDHELITGLTTGTYRLAVLTGPVRGHGLVSRKYGEEHLMFSLPTGHPLAGRKSLRFRDLNGAAIPLHPGIGFWEEIPRKKMPDSHFFVQERSSSFDELVHAYAMPCFSSDLARRGRELGPDRVVIPIDDPEASVEYFLAWRRQDEDFLRPFLDAVPRTGSREK